MFFAPNQPPGSVLLRVLAADLLRGVVLGDAAIQVIRVTDVEAPLLILKEVGPKAVRRVVQPPRVGLEPTT